MKTQIARWGNSLAVRLSRNIASSAKLEEGDTLEVAAKAGVVIMRAVRKKPTLDELVSAITPENCHREISWGKPVGKEIW